jgi:hypothetical protein
MRYQLPLFLASEKKKALQCRPALQGFSLTAGS